MTNKTPKVKLVQSIYLPESRKWFRVDVEEENISIIFCSCRVTVYKNEWSDLVRAITNERNSNFEIGNNVRVDTTHEDKVYFTKFDSFSGMTIEEWEAISDKVTELIS